MKIESEGPTYTRQCDDVVAAEKIALGIGDRQPTGIAFSGGGIRSASFGLGIAQALANHGLLEQFDYLSTVSGGGYLGAAITWMRKKWADALVGLGEPKMSTRGDAQPASHPWLNYLRQHGNYLLPNTISPLALIGIALRGAVVSLSVYFALLWAAMLAFVSVRLITPPLAYPGNIVDGGIALVLTAFSLVQDGSFSQPTVVASSSSTMLQQYLVDWGALAFCLLFASVYVIGCAVYSMATLVSSFSWETKGWSQLRDWKTWNTRKADLKALLMATVSGITLVVAQATAFIFTASIWSSCGGSPNLTWGCAPQQGITIALLLTMLGTVAGLVFIVAKRSCGWYYSLRVFVQQRAGALLTLVIGFGALASVPFVYAAVTHWMSAATAGNLMTLAGGLGAVYQAVQGRGAEQTRKWVPQMIIILASALAIYGLLLLAYSATGFAFADGGIRGLRVYIVAALTFALVVGLCTNLNLFNLGRMYRDRLMETFQASDQAVKINQWTPSAEADALDVADCWPASENVEGGAQRRLYPLINTSAVLVDAASDKFRNRGTDSFTLSPLFCGSDATGWIGTKGFADRHLTLATAVATSGAAVNPHAAGGGRGITRDRLVSFLMFLFQVRLGTWVLNPNLSTKEAIPEGSAGKQSMSRGFARFLGQRPNFIVPGVRGGLLGRGASESAPFVELTDGGHFDNTGLYELLRRECGFLVLSQGSADPEYTLDDLANVIEKARVDFAVEITFRPKFPVSNLLPTDKDEITGLRFARSSFAIADIGYQNGRKGLLVYIQSTRLRGAETNTNAPAVSAFVHEDVLTYARQHLTFPNETTLDQFFTEPQLEAYRELGYVATRQMLDAVYGQSVDRTAALSLTDLLEKAAIA